MNEDERGTAQRRKAEREHADVAALVRAVCHVPIARVSLAGTHLQGFATGEGCDVTGTAHDASVCSIALASAALVVIPDLREDPRTAITLAAGPDTSGLEPRFYAAAPLVMSDGSALGCLCAIDVVPRPDGLTDRQRADLIALGHMVAQLIEARLAAAGQQSALAAATDAETHHRHIIDSAIDSAIIGMDPAGRVTGWSRGAERIFGWTEAEMVGGLLARIFTPEDREEGCPEREMRIALETGRAPDERWHLRRDGTRFYAHGAVTPLVGSGERGFVKTLRDITADHEVRAALDASREELELATRAARLGRFDFRPATGLLVWDDRCRELFGLPPGAPVTYESAFLAGLHPEDRARADAEVEAALDPAGGRGFDIEYRTVGIEDGIERHVAAHGLAIFDGSTPVRLIGAVQDVTTNRRMVQRLVDTEERLRLAARATNDAIWDWDLQADHVQWNDALQRAYGHAPDAVEPTGTWWLMHIHPDDRARVSHSIHAAIDGTDSDWSESYRFLRADGAYADVRDRGYVIRNEHGRATRMIGALLDETAQATVRRSLETSITQRTEELDRLWKTSPDLLVLIDFAGTLRRVNPAWTTILGYHPDELVGHHVNEFVVPEDADRTVDAIELATVGGSPALENRYRHKDGSLRWFSWVAVPGSDIIYATGRHVTAAKEAEAALRAAEDQLRQAQKVEAIGQLTGGVAHDFNNLLTVIRGSVDLLRRPSLSDERRQRYIDAIADTTERATRLTSQLLAFARRQALTPEVFDAAASVIALGDMLRTLSGSRIEITYDVSCDAAFVETDRSQFDTAIVNIAVNARDAMAGEGRLTITVRTVNSMPAIRAEPEIAGAHVAVDIADTGAGILPDRIDHIFEPFFTTKDVGHGTGLGLSQVFGFAKQSGGDVVVRSAVGEGTTFTLYLPQVRREDGPKQRARVATLPTLAEGSCVLVVEDNEEVGRFATQALTELGYRSSWASSADAGLAALREAPDAFHAVFTDVVMPGRSGIELAEEVRRLYPALPVVLTSGYSHVLAQQGTRGFPLLHKPYSVDELATILRSVSDRT